MECAVPNFLEKLLDHIVGKTPEPWRPQPPKTPKVITPGTPQNALAQAQDDARRNPAFQPKDDTGPTFCNTATYEIVKRAGGPLGALEYEQGKAAAANDMARYLSVESGSPGGTWRAVGPEEAQKLANQGALVLAVQPFTGKDKRQNPNHGHIATVRAEEIPGMRQDIHEKLTPDQEFAPLINNIGRKVTIEPASTALRPGLAIHYYTPNR
jgi:hypothetical protein